MRPTIAALFIYPVKSCRGVPLGAARVTERGFEHDREWMIVDTAGRFLTQREIPALAMIVPALSASSLLLTAPGREPLDVPLDQSGAAKTVTVWRDSLPAIDQGSAAVPLALGLDRPRRAVGALRSAGAPRPQSCLRRGFRCPHGFRRRVPAARAFRRLAFRSQCPTRRPAPDQPLPAQRRALRNGGV